MLIFEFLRQFFIKNFEKHFCTMSITTISTESFRIDMHFSWSIKIEFALVLISCSKLARVVTSFWSCSCSSWSRCFKWAKVACRFLTSWTNLKMSIDFQLIFAFDIFFSSLRYSRYELNKCWTSGRIAKCKLIWKLTVTGQDLDIILSLVALFFRRVGFQRPWPDVLFQR